MARSEFDEAYEDDYGRREREERRLGERILNARIRELDPPPAHPEPEPPAPPQYAASATGGQSVGALLGALLAASRPAVAAPVHPPAFEPPRRPGGDPTRPAQESLSLSAVFGEEAAPVGPTSGPPASAEGEPSFDEFFSPAGGEADVVELPPRRPQATEPAPAPGSEDLEQFNAWLRGLKR